jgi:hypothetical protein
MKIALGLLLALAIGVVCRLAAIPHIQAPHQDANATPIRLGLR